MIMYGVPLRVAITSARRSWLLIKVAVNAPDQAFQPGFNYSQDVYHCLTSLGTVSSKSPGADLSVAPLSTSLLILGEALMSVRSLSKASWVYGYMLLFNVVNLPLIKGVGRFTEIKPGEKLEQNDGSNAMAGM